MNRKIRDAQLQKVPYMLFAGDRDIAAGHVSVRLRTGEDLGGMSVDAFVDRRAPGHRVTCPRHARLRCRRLAVLTTYLRDT